MAEILTREQSSPVPAAPSAVEEVEKAKEWIPAWQHHGVSYSVALDLARRLDLALQNERNCWERRHEAGERTANAEHRAESAEALAERIQKELDSHG